jgi:pyruvate-formate lyase-activating enzyme
MIESKFMLNKLISYKGIIHERAEDAPFMGALIIATSCSNGCRGCFNQHLKDAETYLRYADEVIKEVKQNPFNDGIILGGLEWSEQPDDMIALVSCAAAAQLKVMVYTGLTEEEFYRRIPSHYLHNCYIKFGKYDEKRLSDSYTSFGVKLASTNQYIVHLD